MESNASSQPNIYNFHVMILLANVNFANELCQ